MKKDNQNKPISITYKYNGNIIKEETIFNCNIVEDHRVNIRYKSIIKKIKNHSIIKSYYYLWDDGHVEGSDNLDKITEILTFLGYSTTIICDSKDQNILSDILMDVLDEKEWPKNKCIIFLDLNEEQESKLNELKALCK